MRIRPLERKLSARSPYPQTPPPCGRPQTQLAADAKADSLALCQIHVPVLSIFGNWNKMDNGHDPYLGYHRVEIYVENMQHLLMDYDLYFVVSDFVLLPQ
ncbi:MAG: hypothetical protein ACYDCW_17260 [Acidithiobacillus ferrivorans]